MNASAAALPFEGDFQKLSPREFVQRPYQQRRPRSTLEAPSSRNAVAAGTPNEFPNEDRSSAATVTEAYASTSKHRTPTGAGVRRPRIESLVYAL